VVQVVENWTDVEGEVRAVDPHPSLEGYRSVRLAVVGAQPVPGVRDLVSQYVGQELAVAVPAEVTDRIDAAPGSRVRWRVRLARPGAFFAHPDVVAPG
jgi:hypothetical protein